jgi:hypothetical protein
MCLALKEGKQVAWIMCLALQMALQRGKQAAWIMCLGLDYVPGTSER